MPHPGLLGSLGAAVHLLTRPGKMLCGRVRPMCPGIRARLLKALRVLLLVDTEAAPPLERTEMMAGQAVRQITTSAYAAGEAAMEPTRQQSLRFLLCEGLVVTAETEAAEEAQHLDRSVFGTLNLQTAVYRE